MKKKYTNYELELIEKVKLEMGIERDLSDKETKDLYDKTRDRWLEHNFSINEIKEIRNRERENGIKFTLDEMSVIGDDFLFDKKILDFEAQNGKTFPPEILKKLRETEIETGYAVSQKDLSDAWQYFAAILLKEELHPNLLKGIELAEKKYGRTMTFDEIQQSLIETDKDVVDSLTHAKFHKDIDELTTKIISDSSDVELNKIMVNDNFLNKLTLNELVDLNSDFVKLIKRGGKDVEDLKKGNKKVVQRIKGIKNGDLIEGEGLESLEKENRRALEKIARDKKKKKGVLYYIRKLFN